ncbi:protein insensitive [Osmerus eperlanus]|uniref:protein insensitive n=1 Tax=Osmerus eperlanus TaxID=29151 RepID=UPI002E14DB22
MRREGMRREGMRREADTYSQDDNNHAKEQEGWKKDPAVRIQSELQELKHLILGLQAQVACLQKSIENKAKVPEPCLDATVTCPETDHEPRSRTEVSSDDSPRDIPKVKIGPNTFISPCQYSFIKWGDSKKATKELCMAVFGRQVLASHSVTGRRSNSFKERKKPQLDPAKITDILEFMSAKSGISKAEVRKLIAQKCTDEEKLSRRRKTSA